VNGAQLSDAQRNIVLAGKSTSIAVEDACWSRLKEIAAGRAVTVSELIASIDEARKRDNRFSAIRVFVLDFYRSLSHARSKRF
jgi:predicted DNA-binding ribbon-helix-helix protein